MTYQETKMYVIEQGPKIGYLAKQGDKLALRLVKAHWDHIHDKLNPKLQTDFMKVADDYMRRDLTLTTRVILQNRFGHKAPVDLKVIH